jgi:hypothetical protein
MRKVRMEQVCTDCEWPTVLDVDEGDDVKCWRCSGTGCDDSCNASCAAFRIEDGHVYCLALPNAFIPNFAIGELVEEDGGK